MTEDWLFVFGSITVGRGLFDCRHGWIFPVTVHGNFDGNSRLQVSVVADGANGRGTKWEIFR